MTAATLPTSRPRERTRPLRRLWDWTDPLGGHPHLSPESGLTRLERRVVTALNPVRALTYRAHLARVLITTPPNGGPGEPAPWGQRNLRWKAVALLALPFRHDWDVHHEEVIAFDWDTSAYGWLATFLTCPTGWRPGRLCVYTDAETTY